MRVLPLVRWLAGVVLAACHADPPPAPPPSCAQVADEMRARAALRKADDVVIAQTHDVFAQRCTGDAWAPDVMTCILHEHGENLHCKDKLTEVQRHALDVDLAGVFSPVQTAAQYKAVMIRSMETMVAIMSGNDCGKIAADINAFAARAKREIASAKAWEKAHPDEAKKVENDLMAGMTQKMGPLMQTMMKCAQDPAFKAAIDALK